MDKGKAVASSSGSSRRRASHDREADAAIQRQTAAGVEGEGQSSCWRSTISRNCRKFVESRLPRRIMYYSGGRWVDFPEDATMSVMDAFRGRRTAVDIMIGESIYIVDLLNMILIDLSGGLHRSVAWMDELGRFYFPEKDCTPCRANKKELEPANNDSKASNPRSATEGNLEAAEEGGENVALAPSGGGKDADFNAIEARAEHGETKARAEYASPSQRPEVEEDPKKTSGVEENRVGFDGEKPTSGTVFDQQNFNAPENEQIELSHQAGGENAEAFAPHSQTQHGQNNVSAVQLIQLSSGNNEETTRGRCKRKRPSSDDFNFNLPPSVGGNLKTEETAPAQVDGAVNNYLPAKLSDNPENVGSSTASSVPREPRLPTSAWLPFPMLFKALENQVSSVVNEMLHSYFNLFQEKKISRKEMIDRLRMLVGDALIRSILKRYHFSV